MEFKVIISDGGNTYQKEIKGEEAARLVGLRIGEQFDGSLIGESGTLQITGGTDKDGFPMRKGIAGPRRVQVLLRGGPGFIPTRAGERRKKRVRGDTVAETTVQINTKVVGKPGKKKEEEKEKEPEEQVEKEAEKKEEEPKKEEKPPKAKEAKKEEKEKAPAKPIPLTKIYGVGKVTAEQLQAAGITSVQEFLAADIQKLSKKSGLTPAQIEKLLEEAKKLVG
ncbi:MAG: S6e family ribosomal protein [Candidatus Methanofastidiosia archaeon]